MTEHSSSSWASDSSAPERGIIYYNRGTKCLVRLAVSLFSLRQVYSGKVCIMFEGELPKWTQRLCETLGADMRQIAPGRTALLRKSELWRDAPYKKNLYLDTDTLVLKDPVEIFDAMETADTGYGVTRYANWKSSGRKIAARIRAWKNVTSAAAIESAVAFGPAVNTGVFYFNTERGDARAFLEEWQNITTRAFEHSDYREKKIHAKVLDEIGCQIVVAHMPHHMLDETWNRSANHGVDLKPGIVHYHGSKHVIPNNIWCDMWKETYWKLRSEIGELADPCGDKRLRDYLTKGSNKYGTSPVVHKDLTIVTCADPKYAPRLTKNFKRWMTIPGLREQNFLIFTLNAETGDKEYDELRSFTNVRLVSYHSEHYIREAAFSAFVYGTARHVKTKFWMKLDADAEPTEAGHFEYPKHWREYTISADPWHYTRNKPASEREKAHWLNRLDDWWAEEGRLFTELIPGNQRFGHPRLRSFCWIEKTEFTRALALKCGPRLPVPSHDTTAWYVATRQKERIQAYKFRKWIRA